MRVREADALRRWRLRRGLTQRQLAYLVGKTQNTIHLLETGRMHTLTESLALLIAKRLDVPWEDLFEARSPSGARKVTTRIRTTKQKSVA